MTTLTDLLRRVEAATGPDRELDYAVLLATLPKGHAYLWDPEKGHEYTASIDAAVALVERKGGCWEICRGDDNSFRSEVWSTDLPWNSAEAKTAPLATVTALLGALIEKEKDNG